jgi:transcriptional activator of glycolytic enzymes GCR1
MPSKAGGDPGPVKLMDVHTVADVWREWKEGISGWPALEELERVWGARWRPGQAMRMAWCRRKAVLDEIARLIQTGLDPELAVQHLETQQQCNVQTLPSLIRVLQAERQQWARAKD